MTGVIRKLLIVIGMTAVFAFDAVAATPSLLIDDETQSLLDHILRPIFKVADVPYDKNKIHIINDMSLNAFVSDGNHMFINTGTIMRAANVNELTGILAHETGHIAGGHILRQKLNAENLQMLSAISLITAGTVAAASGQSDAAIAVALGTQGSLINAMTAFQLGEERAADESAVKYLNAMYQSPEGLKNFMKTIQKNNRLSGYDETPYFKTHPMSAERLAFFEKQAKANRGTTASPYDKDFEFVQAKLIAFLLPENQVMRKYGANMTGDAADYARAIVAFRTQNFTSSVALLDKLIRKYPNNPYFYQMKGEVLFTKGKIRQAQQIYQKALALKPDGEEIVLSYSECTLEMPEHRRYLSSVIALLNRAQIDHETARGWELLAKAYFEKGDKAESMYALAKYSYALGRFETAKQQIKEAQQLNPSESLSLKLKDFENELGQGE